MSFLKCLKRSQEIHLLDVARFDWSYCQVVFQFDEFMFAHQVVHFITYSYITKKNSVLITHQALHHFIIFMQYIQPKYI